MSAPMFGYYVKLGVRHLRRNPVLTGLIILTIAVGVAASMSTLTILHTMSGNPIPEKSDRLFVPLLDIRPDDAPNRDADPPPMLSYRDAVALQQAGKGVRQTALYGIAPAVSPGREDLPPFFADGAAVHRDFFAMFNVPFLRGGAWSAVDDARGGYVAVVRESIANRVFGTVDAVGKTIHLGERDYVVTGVVPDSWQPLPKYYRLVGSARFDDFENVFLPFATAITEQLQVNGSTSCYGPSPDEAGFIGLTKSDCVWVLFWVELDSAAAAPAYRDFMASYLAEQRKLGRFPRKDNNRLHDVMGWLEARNVVSNDSRLQTYLAFGFLLVCLVNTIGLLLAKFTSRSGEIGVRRALGASRSAVFWQYLIETAVVGLAGGVLGLGLTQLALWVIGRQSDDMRALATMDWNMLLTTFVLAIGACVVAGLLPTWRAAQVRPAVQLKSQ